MASTNSSTSSDALNALEVNLRQLHLEENPSQSRAVTIDGNETVAFGLDTCYMVFPEVVYEEEHVSPRVTPGHYHSGTSLIVEEGYSGAQIIHADNAIDFIISSSIMQDVRDFDRDELPPPSAPKLRPLTLEDDLPVLEYTTIGGESDDNSAYADHSSRESSPPTTPRSLLLVFDDALLEEKFSAARDDVRILDLSEEPHSWSYCGVPESIAGDIETPKAADVYFFEGTPMAGGCWELFDDQEQFVAAPWRRESDSGLLPLLSFTIPASTLA